jgi:hypothetical protein
MGDYSSILKWLWYGSGLLGGIILSRNPDKLVFEDSFWGNQFKTATLILLPASIVFGPITIVVALLLPRRKLCPHCFKAVQKEVMVCNYCGKSMPAQPVSQAEETTYPNPRERFSKEVQAAIAQGSTRVNLPIPFIMIGVWIVGGILGAFVFRSMIVSIASFLLGFVAGWLWWSYTIPRWRKWALEQPGVNPEELQAAAEAALLVWPKGHFFEKTEIKPKD